MGIKQFASMTYEADDSAGSISSKFESDVPIVIMTKDRDYLQLVDDNVSLWMMSSSKSKVLDFYKNHNVKREDYIVPEQAMYLTPELVKEEYGYTPDKTVMVKSLAGDSSDNIPGVKGVGDKMINYRVAISINARKGHHGILNWCLPILFVHFAINQDLAHGKSHPRQQKGKNGHHPHHLSHSLPFHRFTNFVVTEVD
jgi:hypothetical protein